MKRVPRGTRVLECPELILCVTPVGPSKTKKSEYFYNLMANEILWLVVEGNINIRQAASRTTGCREKCTY